MRLIFTLLHRWVGLTIAAFLFISGITGTIISWDHELDEVLNPHLFEARSAGEAGAPLDLARQLEARSPQVWVTYAPLTIEPGHTIAFGVEAKLDPATGKRHTIDYNQVFVDPVTGAEIGKRQWGAVWPISRETVISFLYRLHYTLHIPEMWGISRWGLWLMGGVAVLWMLDCFVGFYLTLPPRRAVEQSQPAAVARQLRRGWWERWKPAWKIKTGGSAYRINFDIHRASGLWMWGVLFILAFTGFALNLYSEVFYPAVRMVSEVTPTPFDKRTPADHNSPVVPRFTYAQIVDVASREAARRGIDEPPGAVHYASAYGIYSVSFFEPGHDHGPGGSSPRMLFFDGNDGRLLGRHRPWSGTAGDIFIQAQLPLHSGRILGLPGRILVSFMGLVVATLSVTGVVIWLRKRRARVSRNHQAKMAGAHRGA